MHHGAQARNEPRLLISFEVCAARLLDNAMQFGLDFKKLEAENRMHIIFTTPAVLSEALQDPDGLLAEEIAHVGAKRMFIDGPSALRAPSERYNGRPFRETLYPLLARFQRLGVTVMLTQDTSDFSGHTYRDERVMCDTILKLDTIRVGREQHRCMEVIKSRGQAVINVQHILRIEPRRGVCIYPRAECRPAWMTHTTSMP